MTSPGELMVSDRKGPLVHLAALAALVTLYYHALS